MRQESLVGARSCGDEARAWLRRLPEADPMEMLEFLERFQGLADEADAAAAAVGQAAAQPAQVR